MLHQPGDHSLADNAARDSLEVAVINDRDCHQDAPGLPWLDLVASCNPVWLPLIHNGAVVEVGCQLAFDIEPGCLNRLVAGRGHADIDSPNCEAAGPVIGSGRCRRLWRAVIRLVDRGVTTWLAAHVVKQAVALNGSVRIDLHGNAAVRLRIAVSLEFDDVVPR